MIESEIEKQFRKYKRKYISKLGNVALDNFLIDKVCKDEFGSKYNGCYAQDARISLKPGYYIFNTDIASGKGEHWISLYITPKTAYIFDSFARDPEKIVPILMKRIKKKKLRIISSDRSDAEQRATYDGKLVITCGHASISWIKCVNDYGIRAAIKI
jgi:hypothetical protein